MPTAQEPLHTLPVTDRPRRGVSWLAIVELFVCVLPIGFWWLQPTLALLGGAELDLLSVLWVGVGGFGLAALCCTLLQRIRIDGSLRRLARWQVWGLLVGAATSLSILAFERLPHFLNSEAGAGHSLTCWLIVGIVATPLVPATHHLIAHRRAGHGGHGKGSGGASRRT